METSRPSGRNLAWAGLCVLAVFGWQFLTVHYNYGGNWTALFCTGETLGVPSELAGENIYQFPQIGGWDGQFYHYVAHDPFLRTDLRKHIDAPRLRYRRILIPALAFVLAGGNAASIDWAYRFVILLFFLLGACWLSRFAEALGYHAAWGLAFFFLPAAIVSTDRMGVDVALAALCVGFALYTREDRRPLALYSILVLAGLARDTGTLMTAAYCIWLLFQKRIARSLAFATAVIPVGVWYLFVNRKTVPYSFDGALAVPLTGAIDRVIHPMQYPFGRISATLIQSLDLLALAGVLLAFWLSIGIASRNRFNPTSWMIILFTVLGLVVWRPGDWLEAYDYGRILTPLLLFEALDAAASYQWIGVAPLCMVLPRIGMQLSSQVLGVAQGLAGIR